jgi:PAS domain S-box-containing protein
MLLPLVARGRTLGVLAYGCDESGRRFSPDDLELAQELARRAALALDNVRMYDAARRAAAELAGLISIAADAIITVDDEQRIVMYNNAAEAIFGWSRDEACGMPLDAVLPERLQGGERQHMRDFAAGSVAAGAVGARMALRGVGKDGHEFPVEAAISKLDIDGKRLLMVVMRDITERQRLEREREAAITMRDDVMGIVAHDLRNPLGTILMQASALHERAGDDRSSRSALMMERAANRMNRLIQDLLDITRIEAGRFTIEPTCLSTREFVAECVDAQRAQVVSASLEIELQLGSNLADIWADPDRLLQVLENLIGNAIKFSRPDGRITVGARASERGDVLFWVEDHGVGIAQEHVPHVFERFWQVQNGRHGAGLGLAIVKGIVEAHSGRVWVDSALGRGTTFFFTIPTVSTAAPGTTMPSPHCP